TCAADSLTGAHSGLDLRRHPPQYPKSDKKMLTSGPTTIPTARKPKPSATKTITDAAIAGITVGWLSPNTAGTRSVTTSRIIDPPVAVNTPIMTQGTTGSPQVNAFTVPVPAHRPETMASPCACTISQV